MRNEMTAYLQCCYNAAVSFEQRYGEDFDGEDRGVEDPRYWLELVWREWRKARWCDALGLPQPEIKAGLGGSND